MDKYGARPARAFPLVANTGETLNFEETVGPVGPVGPVGFVGPVGTVELLEFCNNAKSGILQ